MQHTGYPLCIEDINAVRWQEVIDSTQEKDCHEYRTAFLRIRENVTNTEKNVYQFLADIASFWLNVDSEDEPFRPLASQGNTPLTQTPDNLTEGDLNLLAAMLPTIRDPEFLARVADLLWVCRKDHQAARIAVEAYLKASEAIGVGTVWTRFADRIQRAIQLGAYLGRKRPCYAQALQATENAISKYSPNDQTRLTADLMGFLLENAVGEPKQYSALSEQLACQAVKASNFDLARLYWQRKVSWDKRAGDTVAMQNAKLLYARSYIHSANHFINRPKPLFGSAAAWMTKAVQALRDVQAPDLEIEEAHRKLLEYQEKSMAEMETISVPISAIEGLEEGLDKLATDAEAQVSCKSFADAMFQLARITSPLHKMELRNRLEKSQISPLSALTQLRVVTPAGKTSGKRAPLATTDAEEREQAILNEMFHQATITDWPFHVQFRIEPARRRILDDHRCSRRDLEFLVVDNPFIPSGHEYLFLHGLHAGLHGDLIIAMHLLMPQIENSLRYVWECRGGITSKLEPDETQDEKELGRCFSIRELSKSSGLT